MKTKHLFILGIAALMLALAGCTDLTGPGELSGEPLAQGMGQAIIRLDTGALNGRTVVPGLEGLSFTLDLSAAGKTPVTKTLTSGLSLTVALEPGDWNLEVKGYRNSSILTVQGTRSVSITAGTSAQVDVYLTPDFGSPSVGTLSYSVGFPDTVSRAFLCLYPLEAPGTKETPGTSREIALLGNAAGTITDLPAGSYQALIDLYDGTNNQAAVWAGVMHIYSDAATSLAQTFIAAYFAACPEVAGNGENTLAAKLDAALALPAGSYTVVVDGTETDLASFTPKTLSVTGGKAIAITVRGGGQTVQVNATGTPLFTLGAGLTLAIQELTLKGRSGNSVPVVLIEKQGTLEMKAGSLITGNVSSAYGSGVYVKEGGTFSMNGGAVSDNSGSATYGCGVYLDGGTFSMSGGAVSGNSTSYGGGVSVSSWGPSNFSMSGGTISGNYASEQGGGLHLNSLHPFFSMSGGVIYGSEAEGGKANTARTSGAAIQRNGGSSTANPANLVNSIGVRDTTIDMR